MPKTHTPRFLRPEKRALVKFCRMPVGSRVLEHLSEYVTLPFDEKTLAQR